METRIVGSGKDHLAASAMLCHAVAPGRFRTRCDGRFIPCSRALGINVILAQELGVSRFRSHDFRELGAYSIGPRLRARTLTCSPDDPRGCMIASALASSFSGSQPPSIWPESSAHMCSVPCQCGLQLYKETVDRIVWNLGMAASRAAR
jgi:hypothetical protein